MLDLPIRAESDQAERLFHGRGKRYPGFEQVTIDWLPPVVLICLYKEVSPTLVEELVELVQTRVSKAKTIAVQCRYLPSAPYEIRWGDPLPEKLLIEESGLRYELNFAQQNSGLFFDMANGRNWVREHSGGRNVLNLFAYTCGFSVAARAGGARQVVNVDLSKRALSIGRENHRHNGHSLEGIYFEGVDIFRSWGRLKKRGPYDLLICDPPTFQKGSVDIRKDYPKILRRLPELLNPGADLLLCLNAPDLGESFLKELMAESRPDCRFVERLPNPDVFIETDENAGLKVLHYCYQAS
ncbi:MAG: class I SAM-dependent methyltransferase [Oceanobacter sp.]